MTGAELKERREHLELTQEKLARELDMTVSSIARWEQLKEGEIPNARLLDRALKDLERELISKKSKK